MTSPMCGATCLSHWIDGKPLAARSSGAMSRSGTGPSTVPAGVQTEVALHPGQPKRALPDLSFARALLGTTCKPRESTAKLGAAAEDLGQHLTITTTPGAHELVVDLARQAATTPIDFVDRKPEGARGLAIRGPKAEFGLRAEQRDAALAKTFAYELEQLVAPSPTKVEIDVGQGIAFAAPHALGVEEAFEAEVVTQGIRVGEAQAVRDQAIGRRTTPETGDATLARELHDLFDDQKVIAKAELDHGRQFVLELPLRALVVLALAGVLAAPVEPKQAGFAARAQHLGARTLAPEFPRTQLGKEDRTRLLERQRTTPCDAFGLSERLGKVGVAALQLRHTRQEAARPREFVVAHPVEEQPLLDRDREPMRVAFLRAPVDDVRSRDDSQAQLFGEPQELRTIGTRRRVGHLAKARILAEKGRVARPRFAPCAREVSRTRAVARRAPATKAAAAAQHASNADRHSARVAAGVRLGRTKAKGLLGSRRRARSRSSRCRHPRHALRIRATTRTRASQALLARCPRQTPTPPPIESPRRSGTTNAARRCRARSPTRAPPHHRSRRRRSRANRPWRLRARTRAPRRFQPSRKARRAGCRRGPRARRAPRPTSSPSKS